MLSIRKLMRVVKDVDLEAMPSSIFVNDDDDDDDITDVFWGSQISISYRYQQRRCGPTSNRYELFTYLLLLLYKPEVTIANR